jgi:glycosyltransferase involved in cell wall biosynthesis
MSKIQQHTSKSDVAKSPKQIAFVGNTAFSLYNFRLGVMKRFVAEGYKVFAIAPKDKYSNLFETDNITFINLNINGKGTNILTDILLFFKIIQLYRKHSFNFIFHYTIKPIIYGSLACRILRIKTIAITTGLGYTFDNHNWLSKLVVFLYTKSLEKAKEVWFLNSDDKTVFLKKRIIEESRTFILKSEGVNSEIFIPAKKTENQDKFVFLFLSRLVREKGVEEFVMAAKHLKLKYPNIECQILGKMDIQNPNNIPLENVIDWDHDGIIRYFDDAMDVRPYIANSDCVVLPSYYREGVPRCLLEAMSMKRPIITTDNVGCRELIEDNINGKMCNTKDVENLANKMEEMYLLTDARRNEMGENGRTKVLQQFNEKMIINVYLEKISAYLN